MVSLIISLPIEVMSRTFDDNYDHLLNQFMQRNQSNELVARIYRKDFSDLKSSTSKFADKNTRHGQIVASEVIRSGSNLIDGLPNSLAKAIAESKKKKIWQAISSKRKQHADKMTEVGKLWSNIKAKHSLKSD